MAIETPPFWWEQRGWKATALQPLAMVYGAVAARRLRAAKREKVDAPVLCVGNFTVGGSGKTPVAAALAEAAKSMGRSPGILSRGHGGSVSAPHLVDVSRDTAAEVGDEPLLLAEAAPVAVTADRAAGARLLIGRGCDFLIMDDGFQSARIHIDYALMVIDARYGLGNSRVLPAGPLRAPLGPQMDYVTAILAMGDGDGATGVCETASRAGRAVFNATVRPQRNLEGRRFLAFAGIGHPEKFFATVKAAGGEVAMSRGFADHHVYGDHELRELAVAAEKSGLDLITTAKDAVRIGCGKLDAMLPGRVHVLEIEAVFADPETPPRIVEETLSAWRARVDNR